MVFPLISFQDQLHAIPRNYQVPVLGIAFVIIAISSVFIIRTPTPSLAFKKESEETFHKLNISARRVHEIRKEAKQLYDSYLKTTIDL